MKQFSLLFLVVAMYANAESQTIKMLGKVYYDSNRNGIFDEGDSAYKQAYIDFTALNNFAAVTDEDGNYEVILQPGYYSISLRVRFNPRQYYSPSGFTRLYEESQVDINDTINFGLIRRPAIEALSINMSNVASPPAAGGSALNYKITSNFKGSEDSIPAHISLEYDSLATLVSTSLLPSSHVNNIVEWTIPNHRSYLNYVIDVGLKLSQVGDTITTLAHKLGFDLHKDSILSNTGYNLNEAIHFPPNPIGKTKGLAWVRNFTTKGYDPYALVGVDTATGGMEYFVAGEKASLDLERSESFVAKLNHDGLSIWERDLNVHAGENEKLIIYNVIHSNDGGCFVGGSYSTGLDTLHGDEETSDVLILKLDANGELLWKKLLAGSRSDGNVIDKMGMALSDDGGLIISGSTSSQDGDFLNTNPDTLHRNLYVMKLSSAGNVVWSRVYGGAYDEHCIRIKSLSNGNYMVLANTRSRDGDVNGAHQHKLIRTFGAYFGKDSLFTPEAWILYLDAQGNMIWNKCFGGTGTSFLTGVVENEAGYLFAGLTDSKDGDVSNYQGRYLPLWLLQTNSAGEILWQKRFEEYPGYRQQPFDKLANNGNHLYSGLFQKADGSIIIAGNVADKYGTIKAMHGDKDIFIASLSSNGELLWQKAIGGVNDELVHELCIDRKGDLLIAGGSTSHEDDLYGHHQYLTSVLAKVTIANIISGKVFIDMNSNHIKDSNEPFIQDGIVRSVSNKDSLIATVGNGHFLNYVDTGTFVSRYIGSNNYFAAYPDSVISSFNGFDQQDSILIALVPRPGIRDLAVTLAPLTVARPGFNARYRILTKNMGTESISNVVLKLTKSAHFSYLKSNRAITSDNNDTLSFTPVNMPPGKVDTLDVQLRLASPPVINTGDTLTIVALALPLANDTTPANNQAIIRDIVKDDFNPNDKSEANAGIYTPAMKTAGEPFRYHIHFQNTGTDTAFYVTIKDTLDDRVDVKTLETISSSHPYTFKLEAEIATWQFNMIKLADSATNENKSHGYISFSVKPRPVFLPGDTIVNKAAIYFNYNLPATTNGAIVTFASVSCPIANTWMGTVNSAWENPANWSCGTVPNESTEVFIKAGTPNQPAVNSAIATCKNILVQNGAHVWIKAGAKLDIKGK